ncbi:MAG: hypothetical protein IPL33_04480 [Sphingobacteriales bacterium]|nr:hypothetical protein [Sphingobacteriales bacterium]
MGGRACRVVLVRLGGGAGLGWWRQAKAQKTGGPAWHKIAISSQLFVYGG